MKKVFFFAAIILLATSCSKSKEYTSDLQGQWYVYKELRNNVDVTSVSPYADTLQNYRITFAGNNFTECNQFPQDTIPVCITGTWKFEDSNQSLVLTDTVNGVRSYTIFNLEGNHVELRMDGENRYFRKL